MTEWTAEFKYHSMNRRLAKVQAMVNFCGSDAPRLRHVDYSVVLLHLAGRMNIFPVAVPNSIGQTQKRNVGDVSDKLQTLSRLFKRRVQYLYICITGEDYPMSRPRHSGYVGAVSSGVSHQPFFPFEAPINQGAMIFPTFTTIPAINAQAARTTKICPTSYQCASFTSVSMKPAP